MDAERRSHCALARGRKRVGRFSLFFVHAVSHPRQASEINCEVRFTGIQPVPFSSSASELGPGATLRVGPGRVLGHRSPSAAALESGTTWLRRIRRFRVRWSCRSPRRCPLPHRNPRTAQAADSKVTAGVIILVTVFRCFRDIRNSWKTPNVRTGYSYPNNGNRSCDGQAVTESIVFRIKSPRSFRKSECCADRELNRRAQVTPSWDRQISEAAPGRLPL